jgi:hypothetical protein
MWQDEQLGSSTQRLDSMRKRYIPSTRVPYTPEDTRLAAIRIYLRARRTPVWPPFSVHQKCIYLRPQAPQTLGRGSALAPECPLPTGNAKPYPQKIDPKTFLTTPTSHSPLTHSHLRVTATAPSSYAESLAPDAGETPGGGWGLAEGGGAPMGGVEALATRCYWAAGLRRAHGPSVVKVFSLLGSALVLSGLLCSRRMLWVPYSRLLVSEAAVGLRSVSSQDRVFVRGDLREHVDFVRSVCMRACIPHDDQHARPHNTCQEPNFSAIHHVLRATISGNCGPEGGIFLTVHRQGGSRKVSSLARKNRLHWVASTVPKPPWGIFVGARTAVRIADFELPKWGLESV